MYAEVILPVPLHGTFTYQIPKEFDGSINIGSRVVVQFGPKKIYTGIVFKTHSEPVQNHVPKEILDVLDDQPVINEHQLDFFQWMANYYMCSIGEVVGAALPSALKLSSQTYISVNPEIDTESQELSDREWSLLSALKQNELSINDVSDHTGLKRPQRFIKELSEKGFVDLYEKIKDRYQPKKEKRIRLYKDYTREDALDTLLNSLEKKPKQIEVLLSYLRLVPVVEDASTNERGIAKSEILKEEIGASSLKTLIKNQVFEEWEETVSRLEKTALHSPTTIELSPSQAKTMEEVHALFEHHLAVLLHGSTGSGKTEIYISLIEEQLSRGRQVLYLLPEIALTTQIIARLHKVFGNSFGVYHSRYSENERVEVWQKVLKGEYQFVVGVRSAVFLPFHNLGLIIVDEEHEPSYKQYEPAPRYHARDSATFLATLYDAKVLMGTATPSLETYKNVLDGKFGMTELFERYGDANTPEIQFADTRKERKQKKMRGNFSSTLLNAIEESLNQKEQVILFQNRRGYASYITCDDCGTIPKCTNCAVSLTYHQFNHKLVCHYCGFNQPMISDCMSCGSSQIRNIGFGTEELEEEINILFPEAIVQRMDLDTTRSKYGYQRIIEEFEEGNIDILVGTQMVSKGLDFDKVNLVGIFDADRMIHFPDFRSHERAYDLITQVSGRAGRKSNKGKVIIQTGDPGQPVLERVRNGEYKNFYQWEAMERERFGYPPFTRLINITFRHREKQVSLESANFFARELRKNIGYQRMIGPTEPVIGKIRNLYLHEITLKIEKKGVRMSAVKEFLRACEEMMRQAPAFKSVGVVFDVDPV
ncbi:MAG: primosomal protein N' [Cyclobacteriaceae bacterium]